MIRLFDRLLGRQEAAPVPAPAPSASFEEAVTLHNAGRLDEAQAIYRALVQADPRHADALHMLGLAAAEQGNLPQASGLVAQALAIAPDNAGFLASHANISNDLGDRAAAAGSLRKLVGIDPRDVQSWFNLAVLLHEQGQFQEAVAGFDKVLSLDPRVPQAHFVRGAALRALGQLEAAVASYGQAIALQPGQAQMHFNRGNALKDLKKPEEALRDYDVVTGLQPGDAGAWLNRGVVLHDLGRWAEAVESYDRAITASPGYAQAYGNRANALHELGRLDAALESHDKAIGLQPDYAEAHANRGTVLQDLGRLNDAIASIDAALRIRPGFAEAHYNRGNVLRDMGQLKDAAASYDAAIRSSPEHAGAHMNRGLALLLSGDLAGGWPSYEWRWKKKEIADDLRGFAQPQWKGSAPGGQPLQGKTLLLYAEQGLGDTIQFCRYVPAVKALGARVVLEVQRPLVPLLRGLEGVDVLVARGDALPAFDLHCPLLSLPLAFGTTLQTVPAAGQYLHADPAKLAAWRETLGAAQGLRVGLVWSGSTGHSNDHNRSIRLETLLPQLERLRQQVPGIGFICLQKELRDVDRQALQASGVRFFGDAIQDFSDTAALCRLVDAVVSVDTSVAHLAGALGTPTLLLLPQLPDWRWLLEREDSPWYASMRLCRQGADKRWEGVLDRVAADLQHIAAG